MKHAILTGATGFIGRWLVEELLEQNVGVTALINGENTLPLHIKKEITAFSYDPRNISSLGNSLNAVNSVFYNVGWGGVAPEDKNKYHLQLQNIENALDAIMLAKQIGCKRYIGLGTVAEYVYTNDLINDTHPPSPADIYGSCKVATHHISKILSQQENIDFNWVIVPSTYGERRNDNNLISYTIQTLLKGEKPSFTKLEQLWDFVYIKDVVYALYLIGKTGKADKTYGISSGKCKPLVEYIERIRDLINPSLPLGIGQIAYPPEGKSSSCVDGSELSKDTGFYPKVDFHKGILNTISYFKKKVF